jgi:lipopolysaccharide biosynthesis regulator YciM
MMWQLLFLLLPVAAFTGWYLGRRGEKLVLPNLRNAIPSDYFLGLTYLINEEPDRAVDVFIKLLEVNGDTAETHLALGALFRQRGEVDRAIRIHQNLIARPNLDKSLRIHVMLELGQDYLKAGVLDRAEKLFLELVSIGGEVKRSLHYLLTIYEQEKEWYKAMQTAEKLQLMTRIPMQSTIAHYYCELASREVADGRQEQAQAHLKLALRTDKHCVRACLATADLALQQGQYKAALKQLKLVKSNDPDYIAETIEPIRQCYHHLDQEQLLFDYLWECLEEHPRISVILALSDLIRQREGDRPAIDFVAEQIRHHPSLRGLNRLIHLYLGNTIGDTKDKLELLNNLVTQLLTRKPVYRCVQCGFSGNQLYWQCPGCHQWSTVRAIQGIEGD